MRKVAVLGVPRGGTSLAVGLIRILGYSLPEQSPLCLYGESEVLRWANSPLGGDLDRLVPLVEQVPDGVVWKDPSVGLYSDRVEWLEWKTVRVLRDPVEVVSCEIRRGNPQDPDYLFDRTREWSAALNEIPISVTLSMRQMMNNPLRSLDELSVALVGRHPTRLEQVVANRFVRPLGGYHCPFSGACDLPEGDPHRL